MMHFIHTHVVCQDMVNFRGILQMEMSLIITNTYYRSCS